MIQKCVILADAILASFQFRLFHCLNIGHQLQPLCLELLCRYKPGAAVYLSIASSLKPPYSLIIKAIDAYVSSACEEVVLHILHNGFRLALAGGIVWHAEDRLEADGFHILGKLVCHDVVTVVLVHKHPPILVIHHLLGNSTKVSERQMVGVDGCF